MVWTLEWASRGACKSSSADELFVQGSAQNRAKAICGGCVVRTECLADALDSRIEFGVWGGMTERERRALLKRRPNVQSWRRLLETARDAHLATLPCGGAAEEPVEVVQLPAQGDAVVEFTRAV
jgi:WhiB family redox-sensing transcriptional regulator